ncbi:MAG: hypothetical protein Q9169_002654 [Polycauliona sp. 2 TL-2023]
MLTVRAIGFGVSLLAAFTNAQDAPDWATEKIDKPALVNDLVYLHQGLFDNMPSVQFETTEWNKDWIPEFILKESKDEKAGFDPAKDIRVYDIKYTDCDAAWIVGIHNDLKLDIHSFAELFGRIPAGSRSYVRHMLTLPSEGDGVGGYNAGGDIVLFDPTADALATIIHETAHSLDQYAYGDFLSRSNEWRDKTAKDKSVPNEYAKTNSAEDVAESHIVATYNIVVPGGYGEKESRWQEVHNQYATVQTWQREKAAEILKPGGQCQHRLENSEIVAMPTRKRLLRGRWAPWRSSNKPNGSLPKGLGVIERREFHSGLCKRGHRG